MTLWLEEAHSRPLIPKIVPRDPHLHLASTQTTGELYGPQQNGVTIFPKLSAGLPLDFFTFLPSAVDLTLYFRLFFFQANPWLLLSLQEIKCLFLPVSSEF